MKTRYKLLILVLIVIAIVTIKYGPDRYYQYKFEQVEGELVLYGQEKIKYESLDELEEMIDKTLIMLDNDEINRVVYTIKEDELEQWYYEVVYNSEASSGQRYKWLVYDLIVNDQYCYNKIVDYKVEKGGYTDILSRSCYVSENETKEVPFYLDKAETKSFMFYGAGMVLSSTGEVTTYSSAGSDELELAIDYAYIISQGPGTTSYEEAMEWSWNQVKGKSEITFDEFRGIYTRNLKNKITELELLSNMSLEEIIENYDEYKEVIKRIDNDLSL